MHSSSQNPHSQIILQIPNYQIIDTIYTGSRTLVCQAIRIDDQLSVIIKLLKNEYPSFNELLQFRNQYTITKNINSPLIIQTYNLEPYQNGYALVMEDFGGISLKDYFTSREIGYIASLEEFLEIAIVLCKALDKLYQDQIIHKDIKPGNILINPETKQVKLIDFSIASLLPRETQTLLSPKVLEGTLAYISPEQTGRMNRGIDYRTDFYSLGVTFYELLTGELPFQSNDPMELIHAHIAKLPPLVHEVNPEIPLVLSAIVMKLMAKNAEDRYQSALGLKFDLEKCLAQLQGIGKIESFEIAQRDVSDRFIIPEKLYGRETEVQALLEAFARVSQGATEMMLVAGFSGIGKTAVVNEVHKPIVRQRGYFIKGKYDQFQRNIPFSAFVQAFRDLMGQLLSESDEQIQQWKTKILEAVDENGQIIIEVIPELSKIIGEQPPAPELAGAAAQNRFNLLFQKFTQVFTKAEHPLVIFLDDLQWADSASLKLIQLLMADTEYLFLIGAYRDNEVNPGHPLMLTLGEIHQTSATMQTITLGSLDQVQVNQLIADTLKCSEKLALPLSQLVYQKTQGNPFFATQFLKVLHQDQLIKFDFESYLWQCDIVQITTQSVIDDVVDFMSLQLQKLPEPTQKVLQLAACIGNSFDLKTLAIVSEKSEAETSVDLWKALQEGLILPISDVYKFYQGEEDQQLALSPENSSKKLAKYRFLHDRVQQAAYALIIDTQKTQTHLKIGRLLQENTPEIEFEEKLFDIIGHLNLGVALISQASDRQALAQLNLQAGVKARNSTAYAAARVYLEKGIQLLEPNCWQSQYALTLNLYVAAGEVAYLNGDFDGTEQIATLVLQSAQTIGDKIKIYEIQIAVEILRSNVLAAIEVGRKVLEQLGVELPREANEAQTGEMLHSLATQLEGRRIEDLINLPVMTDPTTQAALEVMGILFSPILQGMPALLPWLSSMMVSLSLKSGNTAASVTGYGIHGMVLCAFLGDTATGYAFGKLALSLIEKFNTQKSKPFVMCVFGCFIQHSQERLDATKPILKAAYRAGIETGDFLHAGFALSGQSSNRFLSGEELHSLIQDLATYSVALAQVKQYSAQAYLNLGKQAAENLVELGSQPHCLIGNTYDETLMFKKHQQDNDLIAIAQAYIYKLLLAYYFGNYVDARNYIDQAKPCLMAVSASIFVPIFHFYAALTHLALFPTQPETEQAETLLQAQTHQTILHQWANNAPMNHLHKWYLVEAERYRILGEKIAATECYDQAISLSQEHQFINEEALANELAAKFYLDWGKLRLAEEYMINAYYAYARWGAKAKAADLETRYPQLLASILHQNRTLLSTKETIFALGSTISTSSPTFSSSLSDVLDLQAILEVFQTLSGEIELDKLLSSFLSIVIENAGADKCVLMMMQDDHLLVKGSINAGTEPVVLQWIPVAESQDIPLKLIYKVQHSNETIVLLNATADPLLTNDPYIIRQQPKSILCSPILHQGKLLGILYLENNLATGAFTSDRVELLNLLCAQAAISLENARLYERSRDYAQKLEQSLEELSASNSRFERLVDNVPGVVYQSLLTPKGGRYLAYISAECHDLFGITPEQAIAKEQFLTEAIHPEDLTSYQQSLANSIQTLSPFKWSGRIVTPSGIVKWIQAESRIEQKPDGTVVWDGLILDISTQQLALQERQQAQQELQKLAAVVENSTDFIGIATIDGQAVYLNPWGRLLVGLDTTVDISTTFMSDFHSQEEMDQIQQKILPQVMEQGFSQTELCLQHLITKEQIPVDYSIFVVNDTQTGQPLYLTAICRDIRDRKQAEIAIQQKSQDLAKALKDLQQVQIQMIQSEKMSALGNLVAGVAHEINNPIGFIAGNLSEANQGLQDLMDYVHLYQEKFPEPGVEIVEKAEEIDLDYLIEDLPKMLESMQTGCDRIKFISKSLRTFSRADTDKKQMFDLHEGIDSTILILRHRLKANEHHPAIEVVTNYGNLPPINCFPGQLNQVFMNILANAIDALEESNYGRSFAEIETRPNQIIIETKLENEQVKIAIKDNGEGISKDIQNRIFDHLFTTKGVGEGTGLGLAIARQIVEEKHSGSIEVISTLGIGTEFIITLPMKAV